MLHFASQPLLSWIIIFYEFIFGQFIDNSNNTRVFIVPEADLRWVLHTVKSSIVYLNTSFTFHVHQDYLPKKKNLIECTKAT